MSSPLPGPIDHCAQITADSEGLAVAAEGNLSARVEHCPDWTVADLVRHMHEVQAFWGQIVQRGLTDPDDAAPIPAPPDDVVIDKFRAGATRLVAILAAANPSTPIWPWAQRKNVGFVIRHQVQEVAVHRWDAEHAADRSFAIDPAAAADSVDEFLSTSIDIKAQLDGIVMLVATDTGHAWAVHTDGAGELCVDSGHADDVSGDVTAVRATASDLLLWLYGRVPIHTLDVIGEPALAEALRAASGTD